MSEGKEFPLDRLIRSWEEFLRHKRQLRDSRAFVDEATALFKELSRGASIFKISGNQVAQLVYGQLNFKKLCAEQPDLVEEYMKTVTKREFDKAAFANDHPEIFKQYQAQRLVVDAGVLGFKE